MPEPRYPRPRHRDHWVIWAFLLVFAVFGGWLIRHFVVMPAPPPPAEVQRQPRIVTLYFAAADGTGLMVEGREIADCLEEEACLKATLQALIDGPVGNLSPVFPGQTVLSGVMVAGGEVQVDFERTLVDGHPGGSWGELLTVHALTNTVAANFPHLRQVRILIEGAAVETLKGHVDLSQPLAPDFSLVLKIPGGDPAATPLRRSQ
jgi:spore germination protein GerM